MTDFDALRALESAAGPWRDDAEAVTGTVTAEHMRLIAETLQGPVPEHDVPPGWLLATCTRWPDAASLGDDGHPVTGVGYPPIARRRRMFAGGRLLVHHPVAVGDEITRRTGVMAARAVPARSGPLLFVTVRHEFTDGAGLLRCAEEHDLAYRSGDSAAPQRAPGAARPPELSDGIWLQTSEVQLFRFSALTANSHRIHYDHEYAVQAEHLPGLLVHGPLLSLLMLETARRRAAGRAVRTFSYRLSRLVVCGARVCARVSDVRDGDWDVEVAGSDGIAGTGTISFA